MDKNKTPGAEGSASGSSEKKSATAELTVEQLQQLLEEERSQRLAVEDQLTDASQTIKELKADLGVKTRAAQGKLPSVKIDQDEFEFKYPKFKFNKEDGGKMEVFTAVEASKMDKTFLRRLKDQGGVLRPLRERELSA